ncbi:MAG: hypothetical protein RI935_699 [Candidatus Parcubacteria bacterium]|jgi:hypothetical protein
MGNKHLNDRGSHTTIIDAFLPVLNVLKKYGSEVRVSPGKIEGGVGAKSSSIKLKHINDELYEMVVVHNGSRQEFKVFTRVSFVEFKEAFSNNKKVSSWNINYTDMRQKKSKDI